MAQTSRAVAENVAWLNKSQGEIRARLNDVQGKPLSNDDLRDLRQLQERYDDPYRKLGLGGSPPPIANESPRTYNRRCLGGMIGEVAAVSKRVAYHQRRDLTKDEAELVSLARSDLYGLSANAITNFRQQAVEAIGRLAADKSVGDFADPSRPRVVEKRGAGGHIERETFGDSAHFMEPFRQSPSLCVVGGLLSKMAADPGAFAARMATTPRQPPPPPPQLGPQPTLSAMLRDIVQDAVAAALPARGSRRKQ